MTVPKLFAVNDDNCFRWHKTIETGPGTFL